MSTYFAGDPQTYPLTYVPFGAQYYRAPTPRPEDWESDLAQCRAAGFNTVKIWAQWRWNQPEPERFDFNDLREIMDIAQSQGLKVVINAILDGAPAWLFQKYPGCHMITASGQKLTPVTTAYRQTGGVPAHCFHHLAARAESVRFMEALSAEFADHPALAMWDLWNEPELTVGLLREPKIADLVCHCTSSRAEFLIWLKERYGTIEKLNRAWWRNYQSWDELELPIQPHTYRDFIDWRVFFTETLRDELIRRKEAVRKWDRTHPVMCHTVPPPIFSVTSSGSDDWLLSEPGDLHGNSVGSEPFAADLLRSAARGKPVINAEIHALSGGTFSRPQPVGEQEMKRHILRPLAHGIKGFLFWQYRAERLGAESPAWGLTMPDGTAAPWLAPVGRIARAIQHDEGFFLSARPRTARVAILADPQTQVFCWAGTLSDDVYARSLRGAYDALHQRGYVVDFVHPRDFEAGVHASYSCLYLPIPYWLSPPVALALQEYVSGGGSVISELWLAAYDSQENLHSAVTPGMGLHELFAVRESLTWPQSDRFSAYAMWQIAGQEDAGMNLILKKPIGNLDEGDAVPVRLAVSEYHGQAETLARMPDGQSVVAENIFGDGRAIVAGAPLGYSAAFAPDGAAAQLISGLVERCVGGPELQIAGPGRADLLTLDSRRFLVVSNESEESDVIRVRLSGKVKGFLGNEPLPATLEDWLEFALPSQSVEAYWIE
ncbi:MAG: beta-galactosidase [Armatimonadetes bacterium]|nr:beta-galactosidase [Armatimonadota bacterium]